MENKIDILISAKDNATKTLNNINKSVKDNQATFKGMATAGAVAFGILSGVIYKSIDSAQESQRVNAQLEAVLKSTGNAVGLTAKQIQAHSAALQKNLGISDEVIASGQNMLLTFTNIGKETFPQATETLIDMATAMNNGVAPSAEALSAQAIQLGKALNDPINGISALSRVGVTFTEQQKETIQSMVDMGDTAGAQKIILDELAREFGGSALAQSKTFEGSMRKLKTSFEDIFENIGTALIPILQKLADYIAPVAQKLTDWAGENPKLVTTIIIATGIIAGLTTGIGLLGVALPVIISGFGTIATVIGALTGPIGIITIALGLFLIAWQNDFLGMRTSTEEWGASIYDMQVLVVDYFTKVRDAFRIVGPQIVEAGRQAFTEFKTVVTNIVMEVWNYVTGKLNAIKETIRSITSLGKSNTVDREAGSPIQGTLKAKALGGPVLGGNTYLVGERGPELFTPSSSGNITPNNQLGGGGVTMNFNMSGFSIRSDSDIPAIARAIKEELTRDVQLSRLGIA